MLAVQVQYWGLKENERHNKVTEAETERHNKVTEHETTRHNIQTEMLGWASLAETTRHNMATESIARDQLSEVTRHNLASEGIGWANVGIAQENARTNWYNAQTNRMQYALAEYQTSLNEQRINNDYAIAYRANEIATMNAQTNQQRMINDGAFGFANIDIRQQELEVKRGELQLDTTKYQHQRVMDIWHNTNESLKQAWSVGGGAANLALAAGL